MCGPFCVSLEIGKLRLLSSAISAKVASMLRNLLIAFLVLTALACDTKRPAPEGKQEELVTPEQKDALERFGGRFKEG